MEHGYESERAALARTNAVHGRFRIADEDVLCVLWTFVEPIRFNARFGASCRAAAARRSGRR
jgi:hypothetical protein